MGDQGSSTTRTAVYLPPGMGRSYSMGRISAKWFAENPLHMKKGQARKPGDVLA